MKLIDIIKNSCVLLGLKNEFDILKDLTSENVSTIDDNKTIEELIYLSKYSIRELCTNYLPMINTVTISTTNKKYPIKNLANYVRIQNVMQEDKAVNYKIINRNIEFKQDGTYLVTYLTYPDIEGVFDELDFLSNFSQDVVVLGLCAYYSLSKGLFEEFNEFHDRYIERAESLKTLRIFDTPTRRWEWETNAK